MLDFGEVLRWSALFLLSCVVPFGIFVGRNNIRAFRREIVRDLERLFSFARLPNGAPLIIPSFELVKYKYDPESNPDRDPRDNPHSVIYYLLPVSIYIVLTALGFRMAFMPDVKPLPNYFAFPISVPDDLALEARPFLGALSYTFIGAYIWTIQYLIRRISNFDLAPISFFQSVGHILLAAFTMAAIWQSRILAEIGPHPLIVIAFLVGFFPTLCIDAVIAKFPWLRLRRVSPESRALQEEFPLDMIIGIDAFMKLRLAEFEIEDVAKPGDDQSHSNLCRNTLRLIRGHRLGGAGAAHSCGGFCTNASAARAQCPDDLRSRESVGQSGTAETPAHRAAGGSRSQRATGCGRPQRTAQVSDAGQQRIGARSGGRARRARRNDPRRSPCSAAAPNLGRDQRSIGAEADPLAGSSGQKSRAARRRGISPSFQFRPAFSTL